MSGQELIAQLMSDNKYYVKYDLAQLNTAAAKYHHPST
jgi:hypothetical protein